MREKVCVRILQVRGGIGLGEGRGMGIYELVGEG